jgi:endonuclease YncB( thermonuclease family)
MAVLYGPYSGVVDLVHDGDTVNIKLDVGFDLTVYARVRVYGINAPELATQEGKDARDFARTLLPVGANVKVVSHGWDKYGGRIDGDINFGADFTRSFAIEMMASGHAVRYLG